MRRRPGKAPGTIDAYGCWTRPIALLPSHRLNFLAVFEAHKSGWPHLHILARTIWLDQEWLSEQMRELLDSPRVNIKRIRHRSQCAGYCAQYVGEKPTRFGNTKRYWSTQRYRVEPMPHLPDDPLFSPRWERFDQPLNRLVEHWKIFGWTVEKIDENRYLATWPP